MTLDQYHYQAPLLIFEDRFEILEANLWRSGEHWIDALAQREFVKGIILPLELATSTVKRQQLWGADLLNWLRWSGAECIRHLPVLALAWEPLATILRRKQDLVLVAKGTCFARLPAGNVVRDFIHSVRDGTAEKCDAQALAACSRGGLGKAAELTHHDLANDFYGAYRLWKGYLFGLRAIREPSQEIQREIKAASAEKLECLDRIHTKVRQPWFRQLQEFLAHTEIPAYPGVPSGAAVLQRHVEHGLKDTRILFVDDEYEKGMAEVLLRILFRQKHFSSTQGQETVYSEADREGFPKARLVCINNVIAARNWLIKWGELPFEVLRTVDDVYGNGESGEKKFQEWYAAWGKTLGWKKEEITQDILMAARDEERNRPVPVHLRLCRALFTAKKEGIMALDDDYAQPRRMKTIVLLDLRLDRELSRRIYATRDLPSIRFRELIKEHNPDLPVIVFTASRQAVNYAEVMSSAGRIDGWLCKEAPDVPEDDQNSRNALEYLFARLHLFAGTTSWYHEQMRWDPEEQLEYKDLYEGPHKEVALEYVTKCADQLCASVAAGEFATEIVAANKGFLGFVQTKVDFPQHTRLLQLLVARRIAIATLLETATVTDGQFRWNIQKLGQLLRGDYAAREARYVSDIVNFRRELWLASYTPELLKLLLPEEYDWLLRQNLAYEKKHILQNIRRAVLSPIKRGRERAEQARAGSAHSGAGSRATGQKPQARIGKASRRSPTKRGKKR